jgi:hypothetical protein
MPTKKKANPKPGGRPTKYLPKYCNDVVTYGKQGKSRIWICATLNIVEQTMINWEAKHPEFLESMEVAMAQSQLWWEDAGQKGMTAPGFNAAIWSRSVSARFPKSWREKSTVVVEPIDLTGLPKDDLIALREIAERAARLGGRGSPD